VCVYLCVFVCICVYTSYEGKRSELTKQIDEKLGDQSSQAYFQAALLYTSSGGERRIRVHTLAVPITADLPTVFACADGQAVAALVAKMGACVVFCLLSSLHGNGV
jgi:hypothetical protein